MTSQLRKINNVIEQFLLPLAEAVSGWSTLAAIRKEWAFTFDLNYVKPDGPLEGAFVKLHYTEYRNGTAQPSWGTYRNAFQSERDLKLLIGIPFSL